MNKNLSEFANVRRLDSPFLISKRQMPENSCVSLNNCMPLRKRKKIEFKIQNDENAKISTQTPKCPEVMEIEDQSKNWKQESNKYLCMILNQIKEADVYGVTMDILPFISIEQDKVSTIKPPFFINNPYISIKQKNDILLISFKNLSNTKIIQNHLSSDIYSDSCKNRLTKKKLIPKDSPSPELYNHDKGNQNLYSPSSDSIEITKSNRNRHTGIVQIKPNRWKELKITSKFHKLFAKISQNYYISFQLFEEDISKYFCYLQVKSLNNFTTSYISNLYVYAINLLLGKRNIIDGLILEDLENLFSNNLNEAHTKIKDNKKDVMLVERKYQQISDYELPICLKGNISPSSKLYFKEEIKEEIKKIRQVSQGKSCDGICCNSLEKLGPYDIQRNVWITPCPCRFSKEECNEKCKCKNEECKNKQLLQNKSLEIQKGIKEVFSWGIDTYTSMYFYQVIPNKINKDYVSILLDEIISKALINLGEKGSLIETLELSMSYLEEKFDILYLIIKHLIHILKILKLHGLSFLEISSKGIGVKCLKEKIQSNELIGAYCGEIYTPWLWHEKQDLIKNKNKNNILPDFYNIILERNKNDKDGYNILYVDPILRGGITSRESHSCNPNCSTVTMISGGKYWICMYATSNIYQGQELTFDYNSVTESKKEYESSLCLCSLSQCRTYYLAWANSKKFDGHIEDIQTPIKRFAILLKSVKNSLLPPELIKYMQKFGFKENILDGLPFWLKNWCGYISESIEEEENSLPAFLSTLKKIYKDDSSSKYQTTGIIENRVQNLAITLNKIRHVLSLMQIDEPPILILGDKEIFKEIWDVDSRGSICYQICEMVYQEANKNCDSAKNNLSESVIYLKTNLRNMKNSKDEYSTKIINAKIFLQEWIFSIKKFLRPDSIDVEHFLKTIILICQTKTYFVDNSKYKKVESCEIILKKWEIGKEESRIEGNRVIINPNDPSNSNINVHREYESQYVWGQLHYWFKQNTPKPEILIKNDLKNYIQFPDIKSFIISKSEKRDRNIYSGTDYQPNVMQERNDYIYNIDAKASKRSEIENNILLIAKSRNETKMRSFKEKDHLYGSAYLETYIDEINSQELLNNVNKLFERISE